MTDNFDNHDSHDDFIEHENGGLDDAKRSGVAGNLAEAWRTRPLFKFMVLLVAIFAVGVAGVSFLGGNNASTDVSRLSKPPALKEAAGGAVSPYMREQTELANKERSEQAIASGGSALPTPIGQTTDIGGFGAAEKKDDPLNELRIETEQLKKQVQQQQAQQQAQQQQLAQKPPAQPEQFDNTLAEAMQNQMKQLLESWTPKGIKAVTVVKPEDIKDQEKAAAAVAAANTDAATTANAIQRKAFVNAGTVSYAQLLTEANSDVPGPILAQIVSGPLAGARAVGSFQVSEGYEKYLVLRFTLADKKGKDYSINAYALDPDTTLGGMATEVDERYFVRVVLPAAAGFLQGMGQALGQGNNSITTNGSTSISTTASGGFRQGIYNGMGQAAQTAGQFFQDQANLTKPLVRVASGTPMGLFFISPVYEPDGTQPTTPQQNGNGYANGGYGNANGNNIPGYNNLGYNQNAGYPGTTVNGYGNSTALQTSGAPYPNYATPGAGYHNTGVGITGSSPYTQGFGQ